VKRTIPVRNQHSAQMFGSALDSGARVGGEISCSSTKRCANVGLDGTGEEPEAKKQKTGREEKVSDIPSVSDQSSYPRMIPILDISEL